jgi:hypothetical protein
MLKFATPERNLASRNPRYRRSKQRLYDSGSKPTTDDERPTTNDRRPSLRLTVLSLSLYTQINGL